MGVENASAKTNSTTTGSLQNYAEANTINTGSVTQSGTSNATQVTNANSVGLGNQSGIQTVTSSSASANAGAQGGVNGNASVGDQNQGNKTPAKGDEKDKKGALSANLQAGAQVGGQIAGARSNVNSTGTTLSSNDTTTLANSDSTFTSTAATTSNGKSTSHTSSDYSQRLQELRNTATLTKGSGFTEQFSSDFNKIQQKIESLKQTEQQSMEFTSSISAKASDVQGMINMNPESFEKYKAAVSNVDDPKFQQEVARQQSSLISLGNPNDRANVALISAGMQSQNPEINNAAREFLSPQGAERYNELSQKVGNVSVQDVGERVDQKAANAQYQIQQAQDRTGLTPNANALPSNVKGPSSTQTQAPKQVNPNLITVDPQSYSDKAKDTNKEVYNGTRDMLSAKPKN